MTPLMTTYLVFLLISAYVTIVVGHRLHHDGRPFLMQVFLGKAVLADAVNHLLLVGYYLVNIAFTSQILTCHAEVHGWSDVLPVLSSKIGFALLVLGGMHFQNLIVLLAVRNYIWKRPTDLTDFIETSGPTLQSS
ncbi:MAG: hypothetical protein JSS02_31015 [Planctomycetes bacterium]|nr:hypothetical protein [Planctomycetota bacterium]